MKDLVVYVLAAPLTAIGRWISEHPGKFLLYLLSVLLLGGVISTLVFIGAVLVKLRVVAESGNLVFDLAEWMARHRRSAYLLSLAALPFFPIPAFLVFLGLVFEKDNWQ